MPVCSLCLPRNHVKGHHRPADVAPHSPPSSLALGSLMDGLSVPLSPHPLQVSGTAGGSTSDPVSLSSFNLKEASLQAHTSNGDLSGGGRGRWVNYIWLNCTELRACMCTVGVFCLVEEKSTYSYHGQ